jgi:hypothetical protein
MTDLALDYLGLDVLLSAGELAWRDTVRAFVRDRIRPNIKTWYEQAVFPAELVLRSLKGVAREPVQQGGQERPVAGAEPRPRLTQLPLQDRDLVTQHQDLHLFCPGRSPAAAVVMRTRSSHSDRPVGAAQPIIMPQQAGPPERNQPRPRRNRNIATPAGGRSHLGG